MRESDLQNKLVGFRRDLHRIPELDFDLPETTAYIKSFLETLPCEIVDAGSAGFCAFFRTTGRSEIDDSAIRPPGSTRPTIAFRSDMDALPIDEQNDYDYKSTHPGKMHACGHDGHMSILLGFALEVAERLGELPNNVLLVFQAAEETTGGAKMILDAGVFERYNVKRVFGLHLWPGYPKHTIVSRKREFMASTFVFQIEIEGRSAHVGNYREGIDALAIGCRLVERVYQMERSEVANGVYRLLRFGIFASGSATNVVSDKTNIQGTLRTYARDVHDFMWGRVNEIAAELMRDTGCKIELSHAVPYPAVVNPEALYDVAKDALIGAGFDFLELQEPLMLSEDFSWYQQAAPGLFLHLGTGLDLQLHRGDYDVDEDVLVTGVRVFKTLLGIRETCSNRTCEI